MSNIQRFFQAILPKSWAADMEADSRRWKMRCRTCQTVQSVWEAGGIRWRAIGGSITATYCQNCRRMRLHQLYWQKDE